MPSADILVFNIASFIAGLFLLEYGADKFVDHTAIVAARLNVSPTLIGLLTCGAEWEELVVIVVALSQKNPNLALGSLVGSSIANVLSSFSLGLLFIKTAEFDRSSKIYSSVLLIVTSLYLTLLATFKSIPVWVAGSLLIAAFIIYIVSVASLICRGTLAAPEGDSDSDSDSESDDDDNAGGGSGSDSDSDGDTSDLDGLVARDSRADEEQGHQLGLLKKSKSKEKGAVRVSSKPMSIKPKRNTRLAKPMHRHLFHLTVGVIALILSSYIIAHSASTIGAELSLSGTVIGTTIVSLATTIPEKFVAVLGGVRHQPGILVANTVGSNIFLFTLCGGIMFLCGDASQLELDLNLFEMLVMWLAAVVILGVVLVGGRRWMGGVMITMYLAFLVTEFANGRGVDED
ncbi:Sodium/calcium exchanger MaX1 [Madurella mycetomatis]|uniref:Sodium/calcium exchanger MaX1 n=1 Tax=Madurella mycetomatis TaxID=100816 RepID=A0A175VQP2_9PEZI|nr:Sodium/calcium exchanger MaX1 [Madurella mycetomatis]